MVTEVQPRSIALAVVVMTLAAACDDSSSGLSVIRSGWVHNQCGETYCEGEVAITNQTTTFTADPRTGSTASQLVVSEATSVDEWRALEREIDTLPDEDLVIGCPGCADEGVEWIEFERSGTRVNVLFSCGATVSGAEAIQVQVRGTRNRLATMVGLGGICMESP
jgi:hypothetical protein